LLFIVSTGIFCLFFVGLRKIFTLIRTAPETLETVEPIVYDPVLEERKENLDRQLDAYNQLLRSLDRQLATETDEKKRASILSKQVTTLEKYNKTMERRIKLGD
jgi:hypothetical protein